jgi:transposase InsO family protein
MRDLLVLLAHLMATLARLLGSGGVKAVVAESLLLKHQLLIINRPRKRAPNLCAFQWLLLGFWSLFLHPRRILRSAVILKPSTLLRFHAALKAHQYRRLHSRRRESKPGPKGPASELIRAIVELKQRNPRFGCRRIAQQLAKTFGIEINKDVVRRVLAAHYRPVRGVGGPSWLTLLGHAKDSLWSLDLFRVESVLFKSHWILVVMDQFTRRIIGFGVQASAVDGVALCRMFNQAIAGQGPPNRLSYDHEPLFDFERWQANLRILEIETIRTVPFVPVSHPFIERLIGMIRREYLDAILFWNGRDLERKLGAFKNYYNDHRVHQGLDGDMPREVADAETPMPPASFQNYTWQSHCNGLFKLPIAA